MWRAGLRGDGSRLANVNLKVLEKLVSPLASFFVKLRGRAAWRSGGLLATISDSLNNVQVHPLSTQQVDDFIERGWTVLLSPIGQRHRN